MKFCFKTGSSVKFGQPYLILPANIKPNIDFAKYFELFFEVKIKTIKM